MTPVLTGRVKRFGDRKNFDFDANVTIDRPTTYNYTCTLKACYDALRFVEIGPNAGRHRKTQKVCDNNRYVPALNAHNTHK